MMKTALLAAALAAPAPGFVSPLDQAITRPMQHEYGVRCTSDGPVWWCWGQQPCERIGQCAGGVLERAS